MGSQIVTTVSLSNKCTQFYILDRYFFTPNTHGQDLFQFFLLKQVATIGDPFFFQLIQIVVQPLLHPEISDLGRIRDKREDGMIQVVIHRFQDRMHEIISQTLPFPVNIHVATP